MPTQLLYLLRVKGINTEIRSQIEASFEQAYDADAGIGFASVNHFDDDTVIGELIFSSVSSGKVFDAASNRLVAADQVIFQSIQFEFDLASGIVAVRGGGSRLRKFINTIGSIAGNKVSIDPIPVDIERTVKFLRENSSAFELTGLLIRNYKPSPDLSGRFAAKVYSFSAAKEILTTYGTDILEFTGTLEVDEYEIKIRMAQSGALALNSTEDGIRAGLDLIKEMSSEKSHA